MSREQDVFFFFFQAEDGIRDRDVTGVQTCALPISLDLGVSRRDRAERRPHVQARLHRPGAIGRASWGKSVDLGGRRIIKKKKKKKKNKRYSHHIKKRKTKNQSKTQGTVL